MISKVRLQIISVCGSETGLLGLCIKLGRGQGHGDACVGTWGRESKDLGTSSMGRGTSNTGTWGR